MKDSENVQIYRNKSASYINFKIHKGMVTRSANFADKTVYLLTESHCIKTRYTEGCQRGHPCALANKANSDWLSENDTLSTAKRWH